MTKPKNATTLAIAQSEELSTICEAQITEAVATANNAARLQTDFLVRELGKECERRVEQAAEEELSGQGDGSANEEEQQKENARESLALSILEADILTLKATLAKYNASMAAEWAAALEAQPKRGILVIAGPQRYSMNAFVSLWAVRKHFKSKLPVIIMYWGEQDGENINKATRNFFYEELGEPRVQFMDASKDLPWPAHHRQLFLNRQERQKTGWVLKLAAAYLVPFQEVLYLDADSALLVSPDSLFELKEYKQRGSLFWPDTPCQRPAIFNELINVGLIEDRDAPGPGERETESGQWLLDRHLHREALEYTMLLGTHAGYTFTKAFGDKDLYRVGFALAGVAGAYTFVPGGLGFAWSPPDAARNNARLMRGYVQFSNSGQPLFHHRAGWETKYNAEHPEGRPLDAFSGPLPCAWTMREWPFDFPGEKDDSELRLVKKSACPQGIDDFGAAVKACNGDFKGKKGQRMPIYSLEGSEAAQVHQAQESGWQRVVERRKENPRLFS